MDGQLLPLSEDLEEEDEGWSTGPQELLFIKVRQRDHPRRIEVCPLP